MYSFFIGNFELSHAGVRVFLKRYLKRGNFAKLTFLIERSEIAKFHRSNVSTWTIFKKFYGFALCYPVVWEIIWQRKQNIASKIFLRNSFAFDIFSIKKCFNFAKSIFTIK